MPDKRGRRDGPSRSLAARTAHSQERSPARNARSRKPKYSGLLTKSLDQARELQYRCPECGKDKLYAKYKPDRYGLCGWFIGCSVSGCVGNGRSRKGEFLRLLAEYVNANPAALLDDPPR